MTSPFVAFPIPTVLGVSLTQADQVVSGGASVTPAVLTPGNITVDPGLCPIQTIQNNGAFTFTAPSVGGSCIVIITNGASAGAVTFSGFNVNSGGTGAAPSTINGQSFTVFFFGSGTVNGYFVFANQ